MFHCESFWFRKRKDTNICTAFYGFKSFFLILQLLHDTGKGNVLLLLLGFHY